MTNYYKATIESTFMSPDLTISNKHFHGSLRLFNILLSFPFAQEKQFVSLWVAELGNIRQVSKLYRMIA